MRETLQERIFVVLLVLLVLVGISVVGYEVYVYGRREGEGYTRLFTAREQYGQALQLKVIVLGARPVEFSSGSRDSQTAAGRVSYREARKVGEVSAAVVPNVSYTLELSRHGSRRATAHLLLTGEGAELFAKTLSLEFARESSSGSLVVTVTEDNEVAVAGGGGLNLSPRGASPGQ
jgi:hypothetical protein